MRAKAGFLILLGLLLITGTVSASVADGMSTIATGKQWVIANNIDSSVITVIARNGSYAPPLIPNAQVTFSVNDANYGLFSATTVTTDINGVATTTFMTKTKSGTAVITATIVSSDGEGSHTEVKTLDQNIDHDLPQTAVFNNPATLPVGNVSILNVTIMDVHGNLVDNKNPAEHHTFNLYMPGGQGRGLWDGAGYVAVRQVETDYDGIASIQYRIADIALMNYIYMDVIGNMVSTPETWIEGIALEVPCYVSMDPPSPSNETSADGVQQIGMYYYLYDQYMNPMNSTPVHITASDGTYSDQVTNSLGAVFTTFGPKDTAGTYTITTTAVDNSSAVNGALCINTGTFGSCSQDLTFHNTAPVDMIVTGNPLSMTSYDVDPTTRAYIQVRVVDIKGNAVIGENVSFSMGTPQYDFAYTGTTPPSITPTSAKTATGGFAIMTFTPGGFATSGADYNATATGWVPITVTWTNAAGTITKSEDVTFTWKNYPYLSISLPEDMCADVKVGDKINVTISILGDGAALRPKPIDVVLVTDVSGSMKEEIADAREAGKVFAASMSDRDRVGLESYGWDAPGSPWNSMARDDLALTFISPATLGTVNATIDTYVHSDYTPQRPAIYNATLLIIDDPAPRAGAVKAILMMTDGAWNYAGDPRGISTSYLRMPFGGAHPVAATESVVTFAKNNGIRIYTVGLGSSVSTAELTAYATETGGKYYHAASSSDLVTVYQQIAGDLQETAGGSTVVTLDFGTVNINDIPSHNLGSYMEYIKDIPMGGPFITDSTYLNKTNVAPNGTMYWYSPFPYDVDNSMDFPNTMTFNVGEVKLNDTWSASFRLNLTQAGKVELFPPTSSTSICFTDASTGATACEVPDPVVCNIQQQRIDIAFGNKNLSIDNMSITQSTVNPNLLTIRWNVTYDGEKSAQQTVEYRLGSGKAITVPGGILFDGKCNEKVKILTVDTTGWIPGTYQFTINAAALDAKRPPQIYETWVKTAPDVKRYIKLE